ncbi:hypothetical protein HPB49_024339 [Dermacentor silvarum]|uniref:Uncharacterized protein n=1 Tax=Dermacentor silvarum TaxID=543639 RepID=A0ACB8CU95_DERSI|nr:hypothetical protein HPB49_024339 [Dermacentor silvarum]
MSCALSFLRSQSLRKRCAETATAETDTARSIIVSKRHGVITTQFTQEQRDMQFEEALQMVGEFGPFQWLLVGYLAVFMVPMHAIPMSAHVFTLLEPPHWCRQPELEAAFHLTPEEARDLAVPRMADGRWSGCTSARAEPDIPRSLDHPAEVEREPIAGQRPPAHGALPVRLAL